MRQHSTRYIYFESLDLLYWVLCCVRLNICSSVVALLIILTSLEIMVNDKGVSVPLKR